MHQKTLIQIYVRPKWMFYKALLANLFPHSTRTIHRPNFEDQFLKSTRQIIKVKKDSDITEFALSESIFTLNFCRGVIEKFDFKV